MSGPLADRGGSISHAQRARRYYRRCSLAAVSVLVSNYVWTHSETTGNDRLVLLAIADEADDDGANAFPGINRIALKARIPKRTVMRCLGRLEASRELVVQRPEMRGRGHHNSYFVVMEKGDTLPPSGIGNDATVPPFSAPEKARKGAQRRAPLPNPSQTHRPIDPLLSVEPKINPKISRASEQQAESDAFDAFWQQYPRRCDKGAARRAWIGARKKATAAEIIDGAARYACERQGDDPKFTKHPSTWLNAEAWANEPARSDPRRGPGWRPTPAEDAADRAAPTRRLTGL